MYIDIDIWKQVVVAKSKVDLIAIDVILTFLYCNLQYSNFSLLSILRFNHSRSIRQN